MRLPTYVDVFIPDHYKFQSANAVLGETTEEFQTANDKLPPGKPCASSTRRKETLPQAASDDSIKSTRGSSLIPPAPAEETTISPEQLNSPKRYLKRCPKSWHH